MWEEFFRHPGCQCHVNYELPKSFHVKINYIKNILKKKFQELKL